MKNTVYIISGPAGVGKSTTSQTLVQEFEKSAYISGDDISHIPVKGRGLPWLDQESLDLIWNNILSLTSNLLDYGFDVVIDYVTFPSEAAWLAEKLKHRDIKVVYVVLLVDDETIVQRDRLRPEEHQMGERSLILLHEFERDGSLSDLNKLYTHHYSVDQLPEIIKEIIHNEKYLVRL
ncbi:AAA family ATPase [Paenibacillus sp. PR3]|uniref:AAA family ATPase n=1 Tax=Paenibacillus terricola TaxID=2763503 RepID=A0ABR8N405_9BACL|nr:AAA family ATPase [Paenibacillus terricola]MBD3922132.1 AAA family ATPase [Paenibacillus terricola]